MGGSTQLCPGFPKMHGRRLIKRCSARRWRQMAKRLLDDAPTKRPTANYSD